MTIYAWPTTRAFLPATAQLRVIDNLQRSSESPLSGYTQTLSMPGARWGWDFDFGAHDLASRAQVEAYLMRLSGREHRVRLWDFKQPRPRGTINLSGVTLSAAAAQFATTLALAGCGAAKTLLAGDWLTVATGQLVRVVGGSGLADGAGLMTVEIRPMLRLALSSGSAVTLDTPTALFVRTEAGLSLPRAAGDGVPGFSVGFAEVFA
jgi:hypothetical protein